MPAGCTKELKGRCIPGEGLQRKWTENMNMNIILTKNMLFKDASNSIFLAFTFTVIFHYLLAALVCLLVLQCFLESPDYLLAGPSRVSVHQDGGV